MPYPETVIPGQGWGWTSSKTQLPDGTWVENPGVMYVGQDVAARLPQGQTAVQPGMSQPIPPPPEQVFDMLDAASRRVREDAQRQRIQADVQENRQRQVLDATKNLTALEYKRYWDSVKAQEQANKAQAAQRYAATGDLLGSGLAKFMTPQQVTKATAPAQPGKMTDVEKLNARRQDIAARNARMDALLAESAKYKLTPDQVAKRNMLMIAYKSTIDEYNKAILTSETPDKIAALKAAADDINRQVIAVVTKGQPTSSTTQQPTINLPSGVSLGIGGQTNIGGIRIKRLK